MSGWHQKYLETVSEGIKYLWTSGHFADASIIVQNKRFRCHRAVLAAMSAHFDATFSSGMRDSPDGTLTLLNIDVSTFDSVLNFIYTGKNVVCEENAESLLRAATTLQVKGLIDMCGEFLVEILTPENCIRMWRLGRTHDCEELKDKAWPLILDHFLDLARSEDFKDMNVDELAAIIKDDDLVVPNEEMVCEAVFRWVDIDPDNRSVHLSYIVEHLRLPLVSPEYLLSISHNKGLLKEDMVCRVMLEEAKRYHMLPARRQEFTSKRAAYRNSFDPDEVIVMLTGGSTQTKPTEVLCYSFRQSKWFYLAPLPYDPGVEFSSCTYANNIYLSGGSRKWPKLFKYNNESNDWRECEQMAQGRSRHGMVAVRDSVYVLGGYNRNLPVGNKVMSSIEKYSINTGKWSMAGDLPIPVEMVSASVIGEKIFTFGGAQRNNRNTPAIQCFDTRIGQSSHFTDLPFACRLTRTVVCDSAVFVITTDGDVIEFSEDGGCRTIGKVENFGRVHFGAVQYRGNIILIGGKKRNDSACDTMLCFDPLKAGAETLPDRMPFPNVIDACVKSVINSHHLRQEYPRGSKNIINGNGT
ncbi:kelch-like protein 24 [Gigantopelta aegis]|uniref:kelch-like protein 24 n=1 Tax=Gigantopelta aegis TaxID=1735272 RepID=UPI001B8887CA|nr:kelch-like protein 24 [Gigantopelta aegis]